MDETRLPGRTVRLPSGRVTFVMTDIEGSTTLLRRLGDGFARLVVRHREIVREAVQRQGGHLFGHEGDSCLCAFPDATSAVAATQQAQAALAAERWPAGAQVAVRMGIHTGEARPYGDNYFCLAVHQAERVASAGHGGQILVSAKTAEDVQGRLPGGSTLRDLGSFRLKDFPDAERLYQVCHPGLRSQFPLPRTLSERRHNLPRAATSFIGRADERSRLSQLLRERRIVTLVGPGGVGKTRLALEVGGDVLPYFPDGVWLVELAAAQDADSTMRACAFALGLTEMPGRNLLESLSAHVESRAALVLLDNCEHVAQAAAALATSLVAAPNLRVLTTSREPLHVTGEQVMRMQPLPTQGAEGALSPAAQLFVERVQAHRADFQLDPSTAEVVSEICRRLDGMPLALELAASRARALPMDELAARLKDRFRLLAGGARDAGARHQTLRATVEWSYELLSPHERLLFERLSVFADGWDLDAAESVCSGNGLEPEATLDLLTALVDKSLVTWTAGQGEYRYGMLETLRDFAAEKLRAKDPLPVQRRLLDWALRLAEFAATRFTGPEGPLWMQRLVLEQDNQRAALEIGHRLGLRLETVRLTAALATFWIKRGRLREGAQWAERAAALPCDDVGARAQLLIALGRLLRGADPARAERVLRDALALAEGPAFLPVRVEALKQLTTSARDRGDYDTAEQLLRQQAAALEAVDDPYRRFVVATELATLMLQQGRFADGVAGLRERLQEAEAHQWRFDRARLSNNLAVGLIELGAHDEALALAHEGAGIFRALGSLEGVGHVLSTGGMALLRKGEYVEARRNFVEVGRIALEVGASHLAPEALERMAAVELQAGRSRIAARYAYAADALYAAVGYEREPADRRFRASLAASLSDVLEEGVLSRIQADAIVQANIVLAEAVGGAGR